MNKGPRRGSVGERPRKRSGVSVQIVTRLINIDKPMSESVPYTPDSISAALDAAETERATDIAKILALFNGIQHLDQEPEPTRKHFAQWGLIAVRGSFLGASQFRSVALASHAAAQAAHDCDAHLQQYVAQDLLAERNAYERQHWSVVSSRAVQAYLGVVGGVTTQCAQSLYGARLGHTK